MLPVSNIFLNNDPFEVNPASAPVNSDQSTSETSYWPHLFITGLLTGLALKQLYTISKKQPCAKEMDTSKKDEVSQEGQVKKWTDFIEFLQKIHKSQIPSPFEPVTTLVSKYLKPSSLVLDVGCEIGKNAACLIRNGHRVVLLDIAPNAIEYTKKNLAQVHLDQGIEHSIVSKIEELPTCFGPFNAVVGTYAFSCIPPHLFRATMKNNVLSRIESQGYFVGGFFGNNHAWASDKTLSTLSTQELKDFFVSQGFAILDIQERIEDTPTVFEGTLRFHTIHVIAQKRFS